MIRHLLLLCAALFCTLATAQDASLPAKDKFHLFLLVGQSNMAGRGVVEAQDQTPHPRVLMLSKEGRWVPAVDPLHFDKPSVGVGIGKTFGQLIAEANPGITIEWQRDSTGVIAARLLAEKQNRQADVAGGEGRHQAIAFARGHAGHGDRHALEFAARFRSRSFGNTLLIWSQHLDAFEKFMVERRARPSVLLPVWHVAGFALGAATALMGPKAAMACTVAAMATTSSTSGGRSHTRNLRVW